MKEIAQIASVKQWGICFRESGVEKGPDGVTICFYLAPMRVPCFRKNHLYHKERLFIKGKKKRLLISCQISPKENDALVAGQLGTNARNTPYTLKIKTHFIAFPEKIYSKNEFLV